MNWANWIQLEFESISRQLQKHFSSQFNFDNIPDNSLRFSVLWNLNQLIRLNQTTICQCQNTAAKIEQISLRVSNSRFIHFLAARVHNHFVKLGENPWMDMAQKQGACKGTRQRKLDIHMSLRGKQANVQHCNYNFPLKTLEPPFDFKPPVCTLSIQKFPFSQTNLEIKLTKKIAKCEIAKFIMHLHAQLEKGKE